jgi:hypothetical protein
MRIRTRVVTAPQKNGPDIGPARWCPAVLEMLPSAISLAALGRCADKTKTAPLSPGGAFIPTTNDPKHAGTMAPAHHRIICHVDVDAMYVGCERELNPNDLLHVPVGE